MSIIINWFLGLFKRIYRYFHKLIFKIIEEENEIGNYEIPKKIIGGYFWAGARTNFIIPKNDLNPGIMTHIYYAFLEVHNDGTLNFQLQYPQDHSFHTQLTDLRMYNKNLKVLFSVVTKKDSFSIVAADPLKRSIFVQSAYSYMTSFEYDGLDLDWEFPKAQDKENFTSLIRELSQLFKAKGLLLTAAVRAIPIYDDSGYDISEMVKYLDIINVMTYDFYGAWSEHTGFNSPLYPSTRDSAYERKYLNVQASVENWIKAGAPKEKICIGIPFYGRTFTLTDVEEHGVHAPSLGSGKPPAATYLQIQAKFETWERIWDDEQKVPYKYNLDQWLGYDDEESIREKVKFALDQDLGGVFVWQLGGDVVDGNEAHGKDQFLLWSIYDQIIEAQHPPEPKLEPVSEQAVSKQTKLEDVE